MSPLTPRAARSPARLAIGLWVLCVLGIGLGSSIGSTGFESGWQALNDEIAWQIVWDIRLPRSVGALAAGALLGLAGALAQAVSYTHLTLPTILLV